MGDLRDTVLDVEVDDTRSAPLPDVWSPTSVNTFIKCPLAYWWQYAQGWRTAPTAALEAGSLVHGVLEELMDLAPAERTKERAREIYAERASELALTLDPRVDAEDLRSRAGTAMTSYFELEDPQLVEVLPDGLERSVSAQLDGVAIAGSVDRLEFSVGGARVVDYKTGGAKPRYAEAYWRQLMLYAGMLGETGMDVSEVGLMYLGQPARMMVRPTPESALTRVSRALATAADSRAEFVATHRWEARTGPLCSYCPFRTACPARSQRQVPTPGSDASHDALGRLPELVWRPRQREGPGSADSAAADSGVSGSEGSD